MPAEIDALFTLFDNGAAACGAPPRAATIAASDSRFLAVLATDAVGVIDAIRALGVRARPYRVVPVVEIEATPELALQVGSLPGVERVLPALGVLDGSRRFANGIDVLLQVARAQHTENDARLLFAGRTAGDAHGYPVYSRDSGLDVDTGLDLPAPPALVPVINLSAGPASPAFPFLLNDLVNIATFAGSLADVLLVLAAGNCGTHGPGSLSAWARAPWVLSVGATVDETGTELAPYSAIGDADDPASGPDLVADGRSYVPPHPVGTSFAAPKVTFFTRLVVAALCQLGTEVRVQSGAAPHGVPLVGCGIVDRFGSSIWNSYHDLIPLQALPIVGVDREAVAACLKIARHHGATLDVRGTPDLVRSLLVEAARPMPGYAPHQVGAGFIDERGVRERLGAFTGLQAMRLFGGGGAIPDEAARRLDDLHLFDPEGLKDLAAVVTSTGPVFAYDYEGQRIAARPLHPDDIHALPASERALGVTVAPLEPA